MKKQISVIVPVYNQIKYFENCIKSLLGQITDEVEVLLIDDGSDDGSEFLCDKYEKLNHNIKTIHKVNGGLSSARNVGIKNAIGEYLLFLDSDDELVDNAIDILLKNIKSFSPDMILYGYTYKRENGYKIIGNGIVREIDRNGTLSLLVKNKIGNQICFKVYKKNLFDNIEFPIGRNYEDIATFYKLVLKSEKNIIIDSSIYIYNLTNNGSITQTFSEKNLKDMYFAINEFENGLSEICIKLSLEDYLEYYKRNIYIYIYLKSNSNVQVRELRNEISKYLWSHMHYNVWKYRNYSIKKMIYFYLTTFMRRKDIDLE